jgi:chloramphenicol 3-O-phosphotransferase
MTPTKKQPLFIVTGASCAGKSTICEILFRNEKDYIVMESDLLWDNRFNTPENGYREYRRLWMRVCANIAQIGKPGVLCGCAVPDQFEDLPERELFTDIHYIAVVCNEDELKRRMIQGRGVTDDNWLKSSLGFNAWLIANAKPADPDFTLLDTTDKTPEQSAALLDKWIKDGIVNDKDNKYKG